MNKMKSICVKAWRAFAGLGLLMSTKLAMATNDLPGGPAVNQLDFHPAVTKIAEDQHWLHNFTMIICLVIFVGVFGGIPGAIQGALVKTRFWE